MAKEVVLNVEPRTERGTAAVRKIRSGGFLPGVIYGTGIEAQALSVPRHDLIRTLHAHGMHALVSIRIKGGNEYLALVKEVQVDAVRQEAVHVDFHRVEENKPVHTQSAIEFVGTAEGVKLGGILEVQTRDVAIEALPRDIPEVIEFDVSNMQMGDVVRVGDLVAPAGVTILTDPEETLASVVAPRVEEAAPALSEEEAAALAALSPEELQALQELAEAPAAEEGEAPAEGGDAEASE